MNKSCGNLVVDGPQTVLKADASKHKRTERFLSEHGSGHILNSANQISQIPAGPV